MLPNIVLLSCSCVMLPLPSSSSTPCYPTYSSPRHRRGYAGPWELQLGGGRESHRQFRWAFPGKVTLWGALIEAIARREKRHRKRPPLPENCISYPPPRTAELLRRICASLGTESCVYFSPARSISKFDRPELVDASEGEEEFEWFDVRPKPA